MCFKNSIMGVVSFKTSKVKFLAIGCFSGMLQLCLIIKKFPELCLILVFTLGCLKIKIAPELSAFWLVLCVKLIFKFL